MDTTTNDVLKLQTEINRLLHRVDEAERLIMAAVGIMTPEQAGQWAGVANWLESGDGSGIAGDENVRLRDEWQARAEAAERRVAELEPLAETGRLVGQCKRGVSLWVSGRQWLAIADDGFSGRCATKAEAIRVALGEPAKA